MVKDILKTILSPSLIREVKRDIRRVKNMLKKADKTSLSDFKEALSQLGLQQGDKVFVTSGFANLNAAGYSPEEAIRAIMETVGQEGLIMMPYYPPVSSMDWVKSGAVFDMKNTASGMGVMTNVFSRMEGVVKSAHPTKALCVWGLRQTVGDPTVQVTLARCDQPADVPCDRGQIPTERDALLCGGNLRCAAEERGRRGDHLPHEGA